jgi:hypothetical protein
MAPSPVSPAMIKDNNVTSLPLAMPPLMASSTPSSDVDMTVLSTHLKSLVDVVKQLTSSSSPTQQPQSSSTPLSLDVNFTPTPVSDDKLAS